MGEGRRHRAVDGAAALSQNAHLCDRFYFSAIHQHHFYVLRQSRGLPGATRGCSSIYYVQSGFCTLTEQELTISLHKVTLLLCVDGIEGQRSVLRVDAMPINVCTSEAMVYGYKSGRSTDVLLKYVVKAGRTIG